MFNQIELMQVMTKLNQSQFFLTYFIFLIIQTLPIMVSIIYLEEDWIETMCFTRMIFLGNHTSMFPFWEPGE